MRKINIPLILGIIIVSTLIAASFYPGKLTTVNPYSTQTIFVDSSGEMHQAPYPPSIVAPFGSDELGRNVYSQIIYGTGQTMKIVVISVLVILMLAVPLGLTAGFGTKPGIWLLKVANITSSAVPALAICILLLNLPFLNALSTELSLYAFSIVIAVAGFGRMGTLIRHRVEFILNEPFIEGQIVMGKSRLQIALQNVIPHLLPNVMVYLSLEAGRTLFLLCQLGVFNVFLGNLKFVDTLATLGRNIAYEPEWGTMLGTTVRVFKIYPWMVFPLIGAFFLGILGFTMLAEGLKFEFEKKNSHFIILVRKIPYFLSPRVLLKDIRQIPKRPFPGILKITVITFVLFLVFFPGQFAYYPFDSSSAYKDIQELSSDKYHGRRSGTEGRDLAADFLVTRLKEAGVKPGGNNGFLNEFKISDDRMITTQDIRLSYDGKDYTKLYPGKDYRVVNFQSVNYEGEAEIVSGSWTPEKNPSEEDKRSVRVFIPENIDARNYDYMLSSLAEGQAALLTISGESFNGITMESEPGLYMPIPVIELSQKWKDKLKSQGKIYARINISVGKSKSSTGKNIIGIIPGKDDELKDEFVIVGASYDGIGWQNDEKYPGTFEGASSTAIALEAAKAIMLKGPPKRTVVFMFWDYSERFECGAYEAGRFIGFDDRKGNLYIDLKHLGSGRRVLLDSSRNSSKMPVAQEFSGILANEYKRLGIKVALGGAQSYEADAMEQRGMGSVVLESYGSKALVGTTGDNPDRLSAEDIDHNGQALLNALIKMIY